MYCVFPRLKFLLDHKLVLAVLFLCATLMAQPQAVQALTNESGDFVEEVHRLRDLAFGKDTGLYVPPSAAERTAFSALAGALQAGDLVAADSQAAALNYELVAFTDTVSGETYHGLREAPQSRGWGSYFVNLSFDRDDIVQAPHIIFDTNSWEVAARAFRQSGARFFMMNGAHRNANGQGTADVAHLDFSIFQEVHKVWVGVAAETTAWQVHGFNLDNHSFPAFTDGVLSNGDGSVSQEVLDLEGELEAQGFLVYAYNTLDPDDPLNIQVNDGVSGVTFSSLGGKTNVQGIHSRGLGGIFVHVELEQSIRFDSQNRLLAANAISYAIRSGLDLTPPMVLGASALDSNSVQVDFSETLDSTSATNIDNYAIDNGVTVSLAVLSGNGRSVILSSSDLTEGQPYSVTVNNVEDLAGNLVPPDSQALFELAAPGQAQVSGIDMSILRQGGKWRRAHARVWVIDGEGAAVPQATVSGAWSGLSNQEAISLTGSDGSALFESDRASGGNGEWTFTLSGVSAEGYLYDPAGNLEDSDCITISGEACGGDPVGGEGTIRGQVKNQAGAKLSGATVQTDTLSTQTSGGGRYSLSPVSAGEGITVSASAPGCGDPVTQIVSLSTGETLTVDFTGGFALQCN